MNINPTFHLSARHVTKGSTLAEATELVIRIKNPRNIVLLPPEAGDKSDLVTVTMKSLHNIFSLHLHQLEHLRWRKMLLVDDISEASASASDAAVDDISESNDDLSNTKPACKRRKTTSKKQQKRAKWTKHLNGLNRKT